MDEQAIFVLQLERQVREKPSLRQLQLPARPLDDDLGLHIELLAGAPDRIVVIAEDGQGSLLDEVHDGGHRPIGIGAVADIVAEKHDPLRALPARLRETRGERLAVGVNVGKDRNQHGHSRSE